MLCRSILSRRRGALPPSGRPQSAPGRAIPPPGLTRAAPVLLYVLNTPSAPFLNFCLCGQICLCGQRCAGEVFWTVVSPACRRTPAGKKALRPSHRCIGQPEKFAHLTAPFFFGEALLLCPTVKLLSPRGFRQSARKLDFNGAWYHPSRRSRASEISFRIRSVLALKSLSVTRMRYWAQRALYSSVSTPASSSMASISSVRGSFGSNRANDFLGRNCT